MRARAWTCAALVGLTVALSSCDEIEDPEILVVMDASSDTIRGTNPVQIFATVTEDGTPLSGAEVMFSTARGTFSGGGATSTRVTDAEGLAAETLSLADDSDLSDVEVSATSSTDLSTFTATITFKVEAGGSR